MRKIVYLVAVVFALGAMSCTKQDIRPNSNATSDEPVWRAFGGDGDNVDIDDIDDNIVDPWNEDITAQEDANNSSNSN